MIFAVIAQLKFAATYMVPSFYSASITFLAFLISLVLPPPGTEWPFAANALMWVGVLTMLGSFALILKKLFGRQPSLTEILSGLVNTGTFNDYKKEQHLRARGLEEQISKVRHDTDERLNADLVRTLETFKEVFARGEQRDRDVGKLRDSVSRLQERTETHLRKLDQYDLKLDNLLAEVSKAAARGVREAQQ